MFQDIEVVSDFKCSSSRKGLNLIIHGIISSVFFCLNFFLKVKKVANF